MRSADALALAYGALARRGKRTALSLVGLAIGVAAVVALTAVGQGARAFVTAQFEVLGSRLIAVLPGKVETTGALPGFGGVPHDLTLADAEAVRRGVAGTERVVPMVMGNDTLEHGGLSRTAIVIGSTAEYAPLRSIEVRAGHFLPDTAQDQGAPVVVLGSRLVEELFPAGNALGSLVRIGEWRMRVIGIMAPQGTHFGIDMNEIAVVPVATAMRMFDRSSLFRLAVEMRPGRDLELAEKQVLAILTERHGEEDVTITTPDAVIGTLMGILAMLTLVLVAIAGVSLSVAGIGIMNVMLVAVSERRTEIGLMKAIGAERRQVLTVFLTEAALLAAAGGVVGLVLGWAIVRALVWRFPTFPASPPAWAVFAAFGVAVATGVFFGWLPARRAVRLDPVDALSGRMR